MAADSTPTEQTACVRDVLGAGLLALRAACAAIRAVVADAEDLAVVDKGAGGTWDPQTIADRRAQSIIIGTLRQRWPGLPIVGEEDQTGATAGEAATESAATCALDSLPHDPSSALPISLNEAASDCWREIALSRMCVFVDPLDGTKSFHRREFTAVSSLLGIAVDGEPVAGVMMRPFIPSPAAASGAGAYSAESGWVTPRIGAAKQPWIIDLPPGEEDFAAGIVGAGAVGVLDFTKLASTCSETSFSTLVKPVVARSPPHLPAYANLSASVSRSRGGAETAELLLSMGIARSQASFASGAGFKGFQVLRGEAAVYAYPNAKTSRWDTCALEGILTAMGGGLLNAQAGGGGGNRAPHKYLYAFVDPRDRDSQVTENKHGVFASQFPALATWTMQNAVHARLLAESIWAGRATCPPITPAEVDGMVRRAVADGEGGDAAGSELLQSPSTPHVVAYEVLPAFTPPESPRPMRAFNLRLHWSPDASHRATPPPATPAFPSCVSASVSMWKRVALHTGSDSTVLPTTLTLTMPAERPIEPTAKRARCNHA